MFGQHCASERAGARARARTRSRSSFWFCVVVVVLLLFLYAAQLRYLCKYLLVFHVRSLTHSVLSCKRAERKAKEKKIQRLQWKSVGVSIALDFDSCLYTCSAISGIRKLYTIHIWMDDEYTEEKKTTKKSKPHNTNSGSRQQRHQQNRSLFILLYSFKCGMATYFQRQRFGSMLSPIQLHALRYDVNKREICAWYTYKCQLQHRMLLVCEKHERERCVRVRAHARVNKILSSCSLLLARSLCLRGARCFFRSLQVYRL